MQETFGEWSQPELRDFMERPPRRTSARQRTGHPVFTSAGESGGHPPKSEANPARTDLMYPLGSCRASPGWPALRAFPLAGIPARRHSRSRRAFMGSAQVSETCFGGDARQLDGRVQRWLPRCRWLSAQPLLAAVFREADDLRLSCRVRRPQSRQIRSLSGGRRALTASSAG